MRGNIRLLLSLIFLIAVAVNGQGTTATILGVVKDSSGAVIPGATIDVKNIGTGAAQTGITDEQGRFTIPELQIGEDF
jgi:Carboxypeptidase regulatory-like domain